MRSPTTALQELLLNIQVGQYDGIFVNQKILPKTAFFPGGYGLYEADTRTYTKFPEMLILGQDFGTHKDFDKMMSGTCQDRDSPTWKNLLRLFASVKLKPEAFFYGNAFVGLRESNKSTGRYIGFDYPLFMDENDQFLRAELELIKPRIIITLGTYAPMVLARLTDQLTAWGKTFSFPQIDARDEAIQRDINFKSFSATCLALLHPCYRQLNLRHRTYKGISVKNNKLDPEQEMLRDVLNDVQR